MYTSFSISARSHSSSLFCLALQAQGRATSLHYIVDTNDRRGDGDWLTARATAIPESWSAQSYLFSLAIPLIVDEVSSR